MKTIFTILAIILCHSAGRAQGCVVTNDGAVLTTAGAVVVTIDGSFYTTATDSGRIAALTPDLNIYVSGDWMNDNHSQVFAYGNSANSIWVHLNGTDQAIGGSVSPLFHNLVVSGSGIKTLQQNIDIVDTLRMSTASSVVELNGKNIQFTDIGVLANENPNSYVFEDGSGGTGGLLMVKPFSVNAPNAYNVGGLGASITSSQNLGSVMVVRGHVPRVGTGGYESIARWYQIAPSNNASLDATLRFEYFDHELNGQNAPELDMWRSDDTIDWTLQGAVNAFPARFVEKSAIDDFSYWTLSSPMTNPLPVDMFGFAIQCDYAYRKRIFSWITVSELNCSHFVIERSPDLHVWEFVGKQSTLALSGNSNEPIKYTWMGEDEFVTPFYYRLVQFDHDGKSEVFSNLMLYMDCDAFNGFSVYPIPSNGQFAVEFQTEAATPVSYRIYDAVGRLVQADSHQANGGPEKLPITINVKSGMYVLHMRIGSTEQTVKIIIE